MQGAPSVALRPASKHKIVIPGAPIRVRWIVACVDLFALVAVPYPELVCHRVTPLLHEEAGPCARERSPAPNNRAAARTSAARQCRTRTSLSAWAGMRHSKIIYAHILRGRPHPGVRPAPEAPRWYLGRRHGTQVGRNNLEEIRRGKEAHVPAEQPSSFPQARLPHPYAHPRRPRHRVRTSQEGSRQPHRLEGRTPTNTVLPKKHKFTSKSDFSRTLKRGVRAGSKTVVVHLHRRQTEPGAAPIIEGGPRFGLVVSKAVGNAVVRHRTSRRLRHIALALATTGALPRDVDVVLRALPAAGAADSADLERDIHKALGKLNKRNSP